MNTHPTHIQVGGWGLQPPIVPIGVEVFVVVVVFIVFSPHLGDWVCVFGVCVCFTCIFGALVCVCVECVFFPK